MVKPVYQSGFDLPEEGKYVLQTSECTFSDEGKGLMCKVKSTITDGENTTSIDMSIMDFFPLYTEFGVARLLGFLIKSIGIPEKDYPVNYFEDEKIQRKVASQVAGKFFGGDIKIVEGKKSKMVNIREYFTQKEIEALLEGEGTEKETSSKKETAKTTKKTKEEKKEDLEESPW